MHHSSAFHPSIRHVIFNFYLHVPKQICCQSVAFLHPLLSDVCCLCVSHAVAQLDGVSTVGLLHALLPTLCI